MQFLYSLASFLIAPAASYADAKQDIDSIVRIFIWSLKTKRLSVSQYAHGCFDELLCIPHIILISLISEHMKYLILSKFLILDVIELIFP